MKRELSATVRGDIAVVAESIRNILVPIDFSPGSTKAVHRAVGLAAENSAAITILYVIDILTPSCVGSALNLMRQLRSEASDKITRFSTALSAAFNLHTQITEGLPWEEIVSASENFDLLVVAKNRCDKKWTCFSQHTLQRVIKQARCPVLAVPEDASEELTLPAHHHTEELPHPIASV